mgnify:CR=1 FL=1
MALQQVHGKLEPEDLTRLRSVVARRNAICQNPTAFGAEETITAEMADLRLTGELLDRYGIESWRDWKISSYTGDIWYEG